jgi:hypothetical protein
LALLVLSHLAAAQSDALVHPATAKCQAAAHQERLAVLHSQAMAHYRPKNREGCQGLGRADLAIPWAELDAKPKAVGLLALWDATDAVHQALGRHQLQGQCSALYQ